MRKFSSRRFARPRTGYRPTRTWVSLADSFALAGVTSTTAVSLMSLQAPVTLALTSDPPEDLTVLRVRGSFLYSVTAASVWVLALVVQDTQWTPTSLFRDDADKRILWSRTFCTTEETGLAMCPPVEVFAGGFHNYTECLDSLTLDISPKVKLEPGKALFLVAYEQSGAGQLTVSSVDMRLLFQRSGRR